VTQTSGKRGRADSAQGLLPFASALPLSASHPPPPAGPVLTDGTPLASLDLPERIPCISLHGPYDALVVDGDKPIESRTWPWPYPPGWLVVHAAHHVQRVVVTKYSIPEHRLTPRGCYLGLVHVDGCRPLLPEDEAKAFNYQPDLHAWLLSGARRFPQPIPVARGPQKFVYLPRAFVVAALLGHPETP